MARCPDGSQFTLQTATATIAHSTPRILMVCIPAGKLLFGFICAHAPISAASQEEHVEWWGELGKVLRKVPRRAMPILLIDANARYVAPSVHTNLAGATASNANAESLQRVAAEHELHSAGFLDSRGQRIATWMSPHGKEAQLDYVLIPASLSEHVTLHGQPWLPPNEPFVDHRALLAELAWRQPTCVPPASNPRWNRHKMRTPEGRAILQNIFRTAPTVPWAYHVEDHLQLINDHIRCTLDDHFVADAARPRQSHISETQWAAIRARRHSRRLLACIKGRRERDAIAAVLQAWKHCTREAYPPADAGRVQRRLRRSCVAEARLAKAIGDLNRTVSKLSIRDASQHTREVLRDAKLRGPAELYGALRGVMKVGRRYRAPQALPSLVLPGRTLADPDKVRDALTVHFAGPEHGKEATIRAVVDAGPLRGEDIVDLLHIPCPSDVMQGWLSLKDNKAAGMSGIPAEVYRYAALDAVMCHAPLFLKTAIRRSWPTLWRGTLNAAIRDPSPWQRLRIKAWAVPCGKSWPLDYAGWQAPDKTGPFLVSKLGPSHHVLAHL